MGWRARAPRRAGAEFKLACVGAGLRGAACGPVEGDLLEWWKAVSAPGARFACLPEWSDGGTLPATASQEPDFDCQALGDWPRCIMSDVVIAGLLILILLTLRKILKTMGPTQSGSLKTVQERLELINSHVYSLIGPLNVVADSHLANDPAGSNSPTNRKRASLVRVYADHLTETEKLSAEEATLRARFELDEFGEDVVASQVDGFLARFPERRAAKDAFYASGMLERDITKYVEDERSLIPHDLFAPLYALIVKQGCQQGQRVTLDTYSSSSGDDYRSFVKARAIVQRLQNLGVLTRANDDGWGGRPAFRIQLTDLAKLRALLYAGGASHDDAYFEEKHREGKLPWLFVNSGEL